jgi:hypothetical protein
MATRVEQIVGPKCIGLVTELVHSIDGACLRHLHRRPEGAFELLARAKHSDRGRFDGMLRISGYEGDQGAESVRPHLASFEPLLHLVWELGFRTIVELKGVHGQVEPPRGDGLIAERDPFDRRWDVEESYPWKAYHMNRLG